MLRIRGAQLTAWRTQRAHITSCAVGASSLTASAALAPRAAAQSAAALFCRPAWSHAAQVRYVSNAPAGTSQSIVPPPTPPPAEPSEPPKPPPRGHRIAAAMRTTGRAFLRVGGSAFRGARSRPLYVLLLLSLVGAGVGFGFWRRGRLRRDRELLQAAQEAMLAGHPLPLTPDSSVVSSSRIVSAFVYPQWAEKGGAALKELASLLNAMPQLAQQIREGEHRKPLQCETTLSRLSHNNALTPVMTPVEAMEKLRVLLEDDAVVDCIVKHVSPSSLLHPLITLVSHPVVDPAMSKYAAVCLNSLCRRAELCEQFANHSGIETLIALAHYTDFQSWNYLYLLQQDPERLKRFQEQWLARRDQHALQSNPLQLPDWLLPYHYSSNFPPASPSSRPGHAPPAAAPAPLDPPPPDPSMPVDGAASLNNVHSVPAFNLQRHFAHMEQEEEAMAHDLAAEGQLIQLLLRLPLVSSDAKREQLGSIVSHLVERGLAAAATATATAAEGGGGDSIVQIGRDLRGEVLQAVHSKAAELQRSAAVALTPALHSSLAGDDLALVKEVWSRWGMRDHSTPPGFLLSTLQRFLARHTYSYSIGTQKRLRSHTARQQEVYYHAIRALATLATDPRTAALIVQQDGVAMLYALYMRYPHELRVQIQVARALANLLEHAQPLPSPDEHDDYKVDPANSPLTHVVEEALAWSKHDKATSAHAAYTAIAHSGFLPMLVHWAQHALNYTDAAVTPSKDAQHQQHHTVVSAHEAAAHDLHLPNPAEAGTAPTVAISTRPSNPATLSHELQRLEALRVLKHPSDEAPSLPIPGPVAQVPPSSTDGGAAATFVPLGPPTLAMPSPTPSPSPTKKNQLASPSSPSVSSSSTGLAPAVDPLPTQLPHHPDSSASLRNKLQLQSFRALVNLRSIQSLRLLQSNPRALEHFVAQQRARSGEEEVRFPILQDEVYLFYPFLDTLAAPPVDAPRESKAQKYAKPVTASANGNNSTTTPAKSSGWGWPLSSAPKKSIPPPPVPPPTLEYDIVFLHGLMGNPLRTWRLHSMHDRTIGWIPQSNVSRENLARAKRRFRQQTKGDVFSDAEWTSTYGGGGPAEAHEDEGHHGISLTGEGDLHVEEHPPPKLSPLELHLSNVVSSGPLPPEPDPAASSARLSKAALSVAAAVLPGVKAREVKQQTPQQIDSTTTAATDSPTSSSSSSSSAPAVPPSDSKAAQFASSFSTTVAAGADKLTTPSLDPHTASLPPSSDTTLGLLPPHASLHSSQHSLDFETLWPRDWLPDSFPSSRIVTLGYSTNLTMKSTGELHSRTLEVRAGELADKLRAAGVGRDGRKIIWVVHSMGGLIVKQILLSEAMERAEMAAASESDDAMPAHHQRLSSSSSSSSSSPLLSQTAGVVFYSTPHRGTWIPQGLLSQPSLFYPSYELLDLQNVGKLKELNAKFNKYVVQGKEHAHARAAEAACAAHPDDAAPAPAPDASLPILSLGEGIGTPLLHLNQTTQRVVSWRFVMPDSSRPGYGSYLYFPTQNHLTICKPKTMLDENYSAVKDFIQRCMKEAQQTKEPDAPTRTATEHKRG